MDKNGYDRMLILMKGTSIETSQAIVIDSGLVRTVSQFVELTVFVQNEASYKTTQCCKKSLSIFNIV